MSGTKKVLLVGHCGSDAWMLKSVTQNVLPGATVSMANDLHTLNAQVPEAALLLINRVLEGDFDSDNGIDLIANLAQQPEAPRMMLVSNYADAQEQAVRAGAQPGFGKAQLGDPTTTRKLRQVVESEKDDSQH